MEWVFFIQRIHRITWFFNLPTPCHPTSPSENLRNHLRKSDSSIACSTAYVYNHDNHRFWCPEPKNLRTTNDRKWFSIHVLYLVSTRLTIFVNFFVTMSSSLIDINFIAIFDKRGRLENCSTWQIVSSFFTSFTIVVGFICGLFLVGRWIWFWL